jgi:hypothetical protein
MNNLVNVSVSFVRREQNSEAHNLVSLAKFVGNRSWLGVAPSVSCFIGFAAVPAVICNQNYIAVFQPLFNESCVNFKKKKLYKITKWSLPVFILLYILVELQLFSCVPPKQ